MSGHEMRHEMRDTLARAVCHHDGLLSPCWSCTVEAAIAVAVLTDAGYLKTDGGEVRPGGFAGSASNSARAPLGREVGATPTSPSSPTQTGDGAVVPGGGSPPSAGAVNTAPAPPNATREDFVRATAAAVGVDPDLAAAALPPWPPREPSSPRPRRFLLVRYSDVTGLTGTGVVAEGAQWTDGTASLRWRGKHPSTVAWANVERILAVHGHQGSTVIRWLDGDAR